jgi:mannose-6-phosphate isomerase-like protein (cupin superfamily)
VDFENVVVRKPWGCEYKIYTRDPHLGIWKLHLNYGESTSLHCHPSKKTALIVLSGSAEVSFLNGTHILNPPQKMMIREGVFHKTTALSDLVMIEVETPDNKQDILRLEDNYNRSGQPYEGKEHYEKQRLETLCEFDTTDNYSITIGNCTLSKVIYTGENILDSAANYVIISGCIYSGHIKVVSPGDVADGSTLMRFARKFKVEDSKITLIEVKLTNDPNI